MRKTIVACAIVALAVGATTATAAQLITGKQIQNGSITGKDIQRGSIGEKKLSGGVQRALAKPGTPGPQGPAGPAGPAGPKGDPGSGGSALSAGNWGVINRNTIHSPAVELRSGPFTPPLGKGSLNLAVADGTEKAAWGNEVDYANKPLALSAVGFHVYNTGENTAVAGNMPSIAFEIDPNVDAYATNYSTLVYTPAASPANAWSGYIDATQGGFWV